jgi:hypothetical protein
VDHFTPGVDSAPGSGFVKQTLKALFFYLLLPREQSRMKPKRCCKTELLKEFFSKEYKYKS